MVQFAILGLLSWQSLSGYDLKKIFADSTILYWSGNSNQIYRALVNLYEAGLVTYQKHQQGDYPAKKVYSITPAGTAALEDWLRSDPEALEMRNGFLVQLAWADRLDAEELDDLLSRYEKELEVQARMQQEKNRRNRLSPGRTARETYLWEQIAANQTAVYENQLTWVRNLRQDLQTKGFIQ
ncbi:MAG TPA: PadR family transcriptional regulator [Anaerolineales bacterium]|nr:PadR family transcriptional regulator [Anaerolineales bacterium]